jgi:UDP-N-acetylmuramoyl-L-alanyl-D-glutamate--2,6-diaminopimelate ligase
MKLRDLLSKVKGLQFASHSGLDLEVKGLSTNSQTCKPGDLFIGMPGTRADGGIYYHDAIVSGAIAAVVSPQVYNNLSPTESEFIICGEDMTQVCADMATAFYDYPGNRLQLIGVTGTNGKTTTTHLIEYFFNHSQQPSALLGTLYTRWAGFHQVATHTTPFAVDLQCQLDQAIAANCKMALMEVSSHALAQGRVLGCPFQVAVFTNLTQDHLDFHKDMEDYFQAKALLFNSQYLQGRAIINQDDEYGKRLIESIPSEQVWSYSVNDSSADLYMSELVYQANGVSGMLHSPKGEIKFRSPLVGQFNLENLLASVGAVLHFGVELSQIADLLPQFTGVPGRMERVQITDDQDISVIVDYAHTPDSLENLIKAARPFISGQVICIFGCGGDRDRTKRPKMGKIAADLADLAVVTSDNPRTEDPQQIIKDVLAGIPANVQPIVESDRAIAIREAILQAKPGDGVLIAGKGHEDYQILGTKKIHFDDREQAKEALKLRVNQ